ncbi:MAG: transporter [Geminicoccaceae bacterium]|nr:transporter [Geminicoccaceae bacterium]
MPQDSQTASPGGGVLAPLRLHVFRALWLANLVSATGTIVQGVGAAWLMTTLAGTPDLVALVQTATYLPILLLALLAGTLADLWDRRRVLLLAQFWMVLISAGLAWSSGLDLVTPATLLLFTFLMGVGTALTGPAWQASVRGIVPQGELAAAVTLNAIAMNFARAVGPAVGGAVVAAAGASAAFYLNAACTLVLAGALLWWPHDVPSDDLPRERVGSAIVTGLRYVAEASGLRAVLARGMVFGLAASAVLALLPLVARDRLAGGPLVYGLLLGAFGLGALAGAFVVHRLRRRYGAERVLTVLAGVFSGALLVLGLVPSLLPPVTVALALAGAAWLGSFSTFNIAVQMTTAFWVQARVLALYQATIFGSMAAGSWLWGQVAGVTSLETSYLAAGSLLLLSIALHRRWRLPASEAPDLRPRQLPELKLAFPFDREAGPVMVLIEYRVPIANAAVFVRAMEEVGHVRKRDGAWRWHLFQDTADAEHWYEAFTVASWLHYLRQRRRGTAADEVVLERARRFLDPGFQPLVRRMIARGREMTMTSDDRLERP